MTTVLFAGGGTGGHIYPNIAIAERLVEKRPDITPHFLVSQRAGDAGILSSRDLSFTQSSVRPFPPLSRPWRFISFYLAWRKSLAETRSLLKNGEIEMVVATGGYVSGPAIVAAHKAGLPRIMVNLDAIPGKANHRLSRYTPTIFSVYETPVLPDATIVGLPLRASSTGTANQQEAREALGLRPDVPVLFITGATHGAASIIRTMMAVVGSAERVAHFDGWQVFHQCGTFDVAKLQAAYDDAGVTAKVVAYCDRMGDAWRAASLSVSRAGAGSVAEAWENAAPTVFLPNPYHKDQHQRHNVQPLLDVGGARIVDDRVDPQANLPVFGALLTELMRDADARQAMQTALRDSCPPDGASAVADWVLAQLKSSTSRNP